MFLPLTVTSVSAPGLAVFLVTRSSFFTWAKASIVTLKKRALNRIPFISDRSFLATTQQFAAQFEDNFRVADHTEVRNYSLEFSRADYRISAATPVAPCCSHDSRPQAGQSARRCARWQPSRSWSCGPSGSQRISMYYPAPRRPAAESLALRPQRPPVRTSPHRPWS